MVKIGIIAIIQVNTVNCFPKIFRFSIVLYKSQNKENSNDSSNFTNIPRFPHILTLASGHAQLVNEKLRSYFTFSSADNLKLVLINFIQKQSEISEKSNKICEIASCKCQFSWRTSSSRWISLIKSRISFKKNCEKKLLCLSWKKRRRTRKRVKIYELAVEIEFKKSLSLHKSDLSPSVSHKVRLYYAWGNRNGSLQYHIPMKWR